MELIKWVPENMYTFSIVAYIVNVYKFSGTHFIIRKAFLLSNECIKSLTLKIKRSCSILNWIKKARIFNENEGIFLN